MGTYALYIFFRHFISWATLTRFFHSEEKDGWVIGVWAYGGIQPYAHTLKPPYPNPSPAPFTTHNSKFKTTIKTTMKSTFKPLPKIAPNDVTLLLGSTIGANIDASLKHSVELVRSQASGSVLYINTVENTRGMYNTARKNGLTPDHDYDYCFVDGDRRKVIYMMNVIKGELHKRGSEIREYLREGYIQYIVINSWEYASRNPRYREDLIFLIKELTDGLEGGHAPMNVLIYAQETKSSPDVQKLQRGGFGKLSGIAKKVECITVKETLAKIEEENSEETKEMTESFESVSKELEANDPRIGTEDEPGISEDEFYNRFVAKVRKNNGWTADGKSRIENEEVESSRTDSQSVQEELETVSDGLRVRPTGERTSETTSIEELRKPEYRTPDSLAQMPIHRNSYSEDRSPTPSINTIRPNAHTPIRQTANVHSDVIQK